MESGERSRQAFAMLEEPVQTSYPGERAFYEPMSGQQDKRRLTSASITTIRSTSFSAAPRLNSTRVALIRKSNFHIVPSRLLNLFYQIGDLSAFLLISRSGL